LEYCSRGCLEKLTPTTACEILSAAHKYQIKGLIDECSDFISDSLLTPESVIQFANGAKCLGEQNLYNRCIKYMSTNAELVLKEQSFTKLAKDVFEDFQMLVLAVSNEDMV